MIFPKLTQNIMEVRLKVDATSDGPAEAGHYVGTQFNRMRVPLTFWLLSVERKLGISLSISSK